MDDFRSISLSLLNSHFKTYVDQKRIGRVEFIPVQWHSALHGEGTGLDKYVDIFFIYLYIYIYMYLACDMSNIYVLSKL